VAHKETIFTGKSMCFTGALSSMTRSEAKGLVEAMGGNVVDSVSKKLRFLVAGSDAGSKLDKAQSLGIQVISEEQFLEMIKET
jgi:DNA ligase (NAD+)